MDHLSDKMNPDSCTPMLYDATKIGFTSHPKKFAPSNTFDEKMLLENKTKQQEACLGTDRIDLSRSRIKAIWKSDQRKAIVTENVGKSLESFGHTIRGVSFLEPEEALYLLEINNLELFYQDIPMSIQQAYTILLDENLPMNIYQTYSTMLKKGFRLIRNDYDVSQLVDDEFTSLNISEYPFDNIRLEDPICGSNSENDKNESNTQISKISNDLNDELLEENSSLISLNRSETLKEVSNDKQNEKNKLDNIPEIITEENDENKKSNSQSTSCEINQNDLSETSISSDKSVQQREDSTTCQKSLKENEKSGNTENSNAKEINLDEYIIKCQLGDLFKSKNIESSFDVNKQQIANSESIHKIINIDNSEIDVDNDNIKEKSSQKEILNNKNSTNDEISLDVDNEEEFLQNKTNKKVHSKETIELEDEETNDNSLFVEDSNPIANEVINLQKNTNQKEAESNIDIDEVDIETIDESNAPPNHMEKNQEEIQEFGFSDDDDFEDENEILELHPMEEDDLLDKGSSIHSPRSDIEVVDVPPRSAPLITLESDDEDIDILPNENVEKISTNVIVIDLSSDEEEQTEEQAPSHWEPLKKLPIRPSETLEAMLNSWKKHMTPEKMEILKEIPGGPFDIKLIKFPDSESLPSSFADVPMFPRSLDWKKITSEGKEAKTTRTFTLQESYWIPPWVEPNRKPISYQDRRRPFIRMPRLERQNNLQQNTAGQWFQYDNYFRNPVKNENPTHHFYQTQMIKTEKKPNARRPKPNKRKARNNANNMNKRIKVENIKTEPNSYLTSSQFPSIYDFFPINNSTPMIGNAPEPSCLPPVSSSNIPNSFSNESQPKTFYKTSYSIFSPGKPFRKSNPGVPDGRLVFSRKGAAPSYVYKPLDEYYSSNRVPLILSICEDHSLNLFTYTNEQLIPWYNTPI